MKIRTTLMMLAASVAPLCAQQPAPQDGQAANTLATPASASSLYPQRAAALPALAPLSANCEMAYSISHIGSLAEKMAAAGMFGSLGASLPQELLNLDGFALANHQGSVEALAKLLKLFPIYNEESPVATLGNLWAENADATYAADIKGKTSQADEVARKAAIQAFVSSASAIPPIYMVLTAKPGQEAMMQQWYTMAVAFLLSEVKEEMGVYAVDGEFKGVRLELKDMAKGLSQEANTEEAKAIEDYLSKRSLHILLKMEGKALVVVLCENPAEIELAKRPEDSLLFSEKFAFCDTHLDKPIIQASYVAPEVSNILDNYNLGPYRLAAHTVSAIFSTLAQKGGENQKPFAEAAQNLDKLSEIFLSKLTRKRTAPSLAQVWLDGKELKAEFSFTAPEGTAYQPGPLKLESMASRPKTILYAESTPCTRPACLSFSEILDSALTVANGFIRTLKTEKQDEASALMSMVIPFLPDAKNLSTALVSIGEGLGNGSALVVDSAGSIPPVLGGKPGNTTPMTRISLYSGVTDRSKLSQGWDNILAIAGQVAGRLGADPSVVQMLPIVPKTEGSATSYSVALPWFTPDAAPNVTLNDTSFAIGSSPELNAQMIASATGSTPFAGTVFNLQFAPLATTLRGLAQMAQEKAVAEAEAEKAQEEQNAPDADEPSAPNEQDSLAEEGEDYEEEDLNDPFFEELNEEPTSSEIAAENLSYAAAVAEWLAKYAKGMQGTHTINNGRQMLNITITPIK